MMGYPAEKLYEEVAFIGYYLHWSRKQVMSLDHRERQAWVAEISRINRQLNDTANADS